ncbi:hypothetical protein AAFF_G00372530 [Aldrovandia affinis]|uniref:Uncharacterized protein n=1 Tax=Aldrovandia affinis TaxID=143900 RepID=A0AAD7SGM5_9TELE|nr:hypothetical protein AAFF_G00372530 [Aldrovandia affinis]
MHQQRILYTAPPGQSKNLSSGLFGSPCLASSSSGYATPSKSREVGACLPKRQNQQTAILLRTAGWLAKPDGEIANSFQYFIGPHSTERAPIKFEETLLVSRHRLIIGLDTWLPEVCRRAKAGLPNEHASSTRNVTAAGANLHQQYPNLSPLHQTLAPP